MSKMISLKRDKEPKKPVLCLGGTEMQWEYFFENGHGIDCFHRLNISADALKVLYRIARIQNKAKTADSNDIERAFKKEEKLWEEFHRMINNPYRLDIEREDDSKNITYVLYDYDYEYELVHYREGWGVSCRLSFYSDSNQPYVEMDEPAYLS
ncbi:MAG: hypothetical protein K6E34_12985 [Lachnospiraceae bacterium]|nr:hypothetical protein [Lachnospiraceae bacterium]